MYRDSLKERYLAAAESFRLLAAKEDRLLISISVLRVLCFSGGRILVWRMFLQSVLIGFLLTPAVIILFVYLLKLYSDHSYKKEFLNNQILINLNEAEAISGHLSQFESGNGYIRTSHDFSFDVDLFGESSLFQYLNRTVTGYGRDILSEWLSDPYALAPDLVTRQGVISELAIKDKWRHKFMASGMKAISQVCWNGWKKIL
jgi:hypothetical protein